MADIVVPTPRPSPLGPSMGSAGGDAEHPNGWVPGAHLGGMGSSSSWRTLFAVCRCERTAFCYRRSMCSCARRSRWVCQSPIARCTHTLDTGLRSVPSARTRSVCRRVTATNLVIWFRSQLEHRPGAISPDLLQSAFKISPRSIRRAAHNRVSNEYRVARKYPPNHRCCVGRISGRVSS